MGYCTAEDVRGQIQGKFEAYDTVLTGMIAAAEEAINNHCNRPDGFEALSVATARLYAGDGLDYIWIDDCVEVTAVAVKDAPTDSAFVTWAATDWIAFSGDPECPNYNKIPYMGIKIRIDTGFYTYFPKSSYPVAQITAKWGYAVTVPDAIKQACITQVSRWAQRAKSGWADAVGSDMTGTLAYKKVLDPDVQMLLNSGRFIRPSI